MTWDVKSVIKPKTYLPSKQATKKSSISLSVIFFTIIYCIILYIVVPLSHSTSNWHGKFDACVHAALPMLVSERTPLKYCDSCGACVADQWTLTFTATVARSCLRARDACTRVHYAGDRSCRGILQPILRPGVWTAIINSLALSNT